MTRRFTVPPERSFEAVLRRRPARRVALAWLVSQVVVACGQPPTLGRAVQLMATGDLAEACAVARALVAATTDADGRDARRRGEQLSALRSWVACLARSGRLDEAVRWLDDQPESPLRIYGRALAAVGRTPGDLERAVAGLALAAEQWPEQAEIAHRAGVLLLFDDQPQRALPWLQRACRTQAMGACRVAAAHAHLDLGQTAAALDQLRRSVKLPLTAAELKRGRALVHRIARRQRRVPPAARARHRQALEQLVHHDRPSAAVGTAQELLLEHPESAPLQTLLGLALLGQGDPVGAVAALRRAAELDETDPVNHFYLARIYQSRGQWARTASHCRRTLRFDPFHRQATVTLGRALEQLGQPAAAAAAFDRLRVLDQDDPQSLRLAAQTHLAARSWREAAARYQRLLERAPGDFEGHLRLAQALVELCSGDGADDRRELMARARQHAERAIELRPASREARRVLEQIDQRSR